MSVRTEIADALNALEGVTAHPYIRPDEIARGTVYVRLARTEIPNRFGAVQHWNAILLLGEDVAEGERYLEAAMPLLLEALRPHLVVTSVEPRRLDLPGVGILPCAFFNGHREAD